ncbi:hypothetical protein [Rhodococcus pyridinivorans]
MKPWIVFLTVGSTILLAGCGSPEADPTSAMRAPVTTTEAVDPEALYIRELADRGVPITLSEALEIGEKFCPYMATSRDRGVSAEEAGKHFARNILKQYHLTGEERAIVVNAAYKHLC